MVVLCGVPGDAPFEYIADALEELNHPFIILSARKLDQVSCYYQIAKGKIEGELSVGNKSCMLSEVTGVYNRMVDFSLTPEYRQLKTWDSKYVELRKKSDAINNWINVSQCRVLNQNEPMKSNCSKLYQMLLIKKAGLWVPDSFVTNNTASLKKYQEEKGRLIYKSASGVRSIVAEFTWDNRVALIENCPTLFQSFITGTNYRVHIVGKKVFATKINSTAVDYRYAAKENKENHLEEVKLPTEIEKKCLLLSQYLNLPLAGIDLIQSQDGRWYCFEVNPSPGYTFFENATGQPIAAAIAKYLAGKD